MKAPFQDPKSAIHKAKSLQKGGRLVFNLTREMADGILCRNIFLACSHAQHCAAIASRVFIQLGWKGLWHEISFI